MKNRFWIYILVMVVAILALLFWRRPKRNATVPTPLSATVQMTNQSLPSNPTVVPQNVSHAPQPVILRTNKKSSTTINPRSPEGVRQYIESQNVPVEFYGQFIDQDNNAVSGVNIKVSIRHWTMPDPMVSQAGSKEIYLEQTSDTDGRFELTGATGDGIDIESIQKDGYQLSPKAPNHFGPSSGSSENPVIIKMWKEGLKESLIGGSHVFGIDSGKTYTLNLITGKKIEGEAEGDLRAMITRPSGVGPHDKFAWSFSIEAIEGGFAEPDSNDEFMYTAPESGYQPKIEMQFDPNDPNWTGVINKQFFIRSRNGQVYGRAKIEIDSIYNVHSAIQIDYMINPNGSRNLQP